MIAKEATAFWSVEGKGVRLLARTAHNRQLSEMAVGVETGSLLLPMTLVIVRAMAHPVRHFAKLPGVMCNLGWLGGRLTSMLAKTAKV